MSDEGIYTINTDGTGEQQITSGGIIPTWQPIMASDYATEADTNSIVIPNVPNTAMGESQNYSGIILLIGLAGLIILAAILIKLRKNNKNRSLKV